MRRAFLFGKLPAHGDFVSRGLATAERDALDDWLAGSLADARDGAGPSFEALYDQAPPWRFAARDVDGWRAGALAPSVDAVGRRYPILIGLAGLDGAEVTAAAAMLEGSIYDALDAGWPADRLTEAAASCAPAPDSVWTGGDRWWTVGGGTGTGQVFRADGLDGARPARLMRAMLGLDEREREGAA